MKKITLNIESPCPFGDKKNYYYVIRIYDNEKNCNIPLPYDPEMPMKEQIENLTQGLKDIGEFYESTKEDAKDEDIKKTLKDLMGFVTDRDELKRKISVLETFLKQEVNFK